MASLPTNQAADVLNQIISLLMSGGTKAAEAYLTSLAPETLAIPLVAWIMDQGVEYIAQIISVAGQNFATSIVIDIQTHGEESSVVTSGVALQIALASNDKVAISSATQALTQAYQNLIHFDGIAPAK